MSADRRPASRAVTGPDAGACDMEVATGTADAFAVVVPARNEAANIEACLDSLVLQGQDLLVMVSDNGSDDGTAALAQGHTGQLAVAVRTVSSLPVSGHFVSAARWALERTDAEVLAFLAADDHWDPGFVRAALQCLKDNPDADVVYPTFVWQGVTTRRRLEPTSFRQKSRLGRVCSALFLPDRRELANLVYGVYRRQAFQLLVEAWDAGGEDFAADYAAAVSVVASHRVVACDHAVGYRSVREGADLLERIGRHRSDARGPLALAALYVRVCVDVNRRISLALRRLPQAPGWLRPWQVQLVRAPQWLWGGLVQSRVRLAEVRRSRV